ncbi:MAG TPA: choline ABC transporter substrate-binding protein [Mesorhizobium sp.]|nr:choline ABC transporter substrate-binding protein [Mesorhizobium sp.]
MVFRSGVIGISILVCVGAPAWSAEPESCRQVRVADGGWTDNVAQNGIATVILDALGYTPTTQLLSVPIIYKSMENGDIDFFLDNWSPSSDPMTGPYLEAGTMEKVRTNLTGAKYTLAVPQYVWDEGLKSFADIAEHREKLDGKIHGIEPGNDSNTNVLKMIEANAVGLAGFELVESSEQGMLSELSRKERRKEWIVFIGWAPHPMNVDHDIEYLEGGDEWFGPNFGGAEVWTGARKFYVQECPNVGRFLKNLEFSIDMESEMMGWILTDGLDGPAAARKWMAAHPEALATWLSGVTTVDGGSAEEAVKAALAL